MSASAGPAPVRLATRDFWLITIAHFLSACGYSSPLLLPLYLDHLGASRAQIGTIVAIASVPGLLFRPFAAWALDVLGRKPTMFAGTALLVVSMALIAAVTDLGPLIYVDRVLYGIAMAALFPGFFALAADVIPDARRTEGFALFGLAGLLPLMLNPVSKELGLTGEELRWLFPAVGGIIASSALFFGMVPETGHRAQRGEFKVRAVLSALARRPLWPVWLATIVFSGLLGAVFAFATVAADKRAVAQPAMIWLAYAAGAVAVRLLGARLPDRVGTWNLVTPALALYITGTVLIAGAWTSTEFFVAGLVTGLGHGYSFPVLSSQVVARMPPELSGTGLAMFTALWEATSLILTPLCGVFADGYGDSAMFALAALFGVVCLAWWVWLEHRHGGPGAAVPR